ncbi:MAG: hypothetical protein K6F61_08085 [Clostridiales bacterium]|nr:hypothetical protein [Clostridiales bacterium]
MPDTCVCRKCGCEGAKSYPLVAFRTMTVRSGGKIQKYQAMGEVLSIDLCTACIDAWTAKRDEPRHQIVKAIKYPVGLAIMAIAVHFLEQSNIVKWVLCVLFSGFAVAIAVKEIKRIRLETKDIRAGNGNFSRDHMTEELAASLLPGKHADAHLSYILRARVMDTKQHEQISREYGISKKKLAQARQYLTVTPETEVEAWNKMHRGDEKK